MKRIAPLTVGAALCGWFVLTALQPDIPSLPAQTSHREATGGGVPDFTANTSSTGTSRTATASTPQAQTALSARAAGRQTTPPATPSPFLALVNPAQPLPPAALASPAFRRLRSVRILETQRTNSPATEEVNLQHLIETEGKYPHVVVEQKFAAEVNGEPGTLKEEVSFAADAVLVRLNDPAALESLAARGEIHSFRRIARNIFRVHLVRPTLKAVADAKRDLSARIPGIAEIEPDYLVFTTQEPEHVTSIDRNGDGLLDEELSGPMAVETTQDPVSTLSPSLILKDVEQRLANVPLGSRVLTFDLPLTDARPQVAYRPYLMEQNFLFVAAPSQYASIYPQPPYTSGYPSNGTIYVRSLSGDSGMQIRHKDSLPFAIYQLDLSEYSTVFPVSKSVTFTGYRKDGTIVSHTFTTDGLIDGTGPLEDFETFVFPPSFSNLDRIVIPTQGFMMDNLVVAPSGEETPLPPPPALPMLYDITWDGFPHQVDQITAVGGPYAPTTLNFGAPRVKSQIGPMVGPALELRGTGSGYEQFTCVLGRNGKSYTAEFDMTMPSGGSLALFFDRQSALARIDFSGSGSISSTFGFSGTFTPSAVTRFRFEVDPVNSHCKVLRNGTQIYSGSFSGLNASGDVLDVRFSATVSSTQAIGIDNLQISGDIRENPLPAGPRALITPTSLNFPTTSSGMDAARGVRIDNIGSETLLVSNPRTDSLHFQTDAQASLSLLPGQGGTLFVTYAPRLAGTHTGKLHFDTNESGKTTQIVNLSGTATGAPAVHLTPPTLHVAMLPDELGTEYFTIHNTGTAALQWRFASEPPANPVNPLTPNDPQFNSLWGMSSPTAGTGGIDAVRAWRTTTDARRVKVAVIDTGVDYNHQDLAANIALNSGEVPGNGIDDDRNGFVDDIRGWDFQSNDADPMDDHGHGTHVSGTIGAAGHNSLGVTGVAWNAAIVPIKFLSSKGTGYTSDAIACVDYARLTGCRVINASWGGGGYSSLLRDTIDEFTKANDALFIASAGNSFRSNDTQPSFPASYDVSGIISVAASDSYDRLASFSNFGLNSVHIAAPGSGILSCAPGNGYKVASGTSMAAPHVAGSAALLFSYHPALTGSECMQRLIGNADYPPGLSGKVRFGSRLNVYSALSSSVLPWIKPAVWSGSVPAPGNLRVPLSLDTHGMTAGDYTASLALQTNDPAQPRIQISVKLKVKQRHRFNEWSAEQFAVNNLLFDADAVSTWAASADPDQDGNSNLLEFLTGADPTEAAALPVDTNVDPTLGRTFRYEMRSDLGGVQYRVEWTDDLTSETWRTEGLQTRRIQSDLNRQIDLWEVHLPDSTNIPSLFFRIVASEE